MTQWTDDVARDRETSHLGSLVALGDRASGDRPKAAAWPPQSKAPTPIAISR